MAKRRSISRLSDGSVNLFVSKRSNALSADTLAALEGKANVTHTQPVSTITVDAGMSYPSANDFANGFEVVGLSGAPFVGRIPSRFRRLGDGIVWDYLAECERLVPGSTQNFSDGFGSALARWYRYVEANGLHSSLIGGMNAPKAVQTLLVFPSAIKELNFINLLNPKAAKYVPKQYGGSIADYTVFQYPGGEIVKSPANHHGYDLGSTAIEIFGHAHTRLTGAVGTALVTGQIYNIISAAGGADFTVSGAANNNVGTIFTANGVQPTWGTGGILERHWNDWIMASYSNKVPTGGSDDNFLGGRDDTVAPGHRFFMTANATDFRFSAGLTSGQFSFAHSSLRKGLTFHGVAAHPSAGGNLSRRVTRRSASTSNASFGGIGDANGAPRVATQLWGMTYFGPGAGGSTHNAPCSGIFAGCAQFGPVNFVSQNSGAKAIELSFELENLYAVCASEMAALFNPTWGGAVL